MFLSSPEYCASNIKQARITNAGAAAATAPDGERQPAVVLSTKEARSTPCCQQPKLSG